MGKNLIRDWKNIEFDYMYNDEVATHVKIVNGDVSFYNNLSIPYYWHAFPRQESVNFVDVEKLLSYMVFPKERVNMREVLESLDLTEYNVFRIVEISHGVIFNHRSWIRFEGETLSCKEVREQNGLVY